MAGIGAISGYGPSAAYAQSYYANMAASRARGANPAQVNTPVASVSRVPQLPEDVPVTQPIPAAGANTPLPTADALMSAGEALARMRTKYTDGAPAAPDLASATAELPQPRGSYAPDAADTLARMRVEYDIPGLSPEGSAGDTALQGLTDGGDGGKTVAEVFEEEECQTCKERKYQDGSDAPGFKTSTGVAPEMAASAVRGHEQEHVTRERATPSRADTS